MKFNITVTATAATTYEVEIDASSESRAEDIACSRDVFNENTSDEFGVDVKNCSFETEAVQLTNDCEECGVEYPMPNDDTRWCKCAAFGGSRHIVVDGVCVLPPWGIEDQYSCAACDLRLTAEYAAEDAQHKLGGA